MTCILFYLHFPGENLAAMHHRNYSAQMTPVSLTTMAAALLALLSKSISSHVQWLQGEASWRKNSSHLMAMRKLGPMDSSRPRQLRSAICSFFFLPIEWSREKQERQFVPGHGQLASTSLSMCRFQQRFVLGFCLIACYALACERFGMRRLLHMWAVTVGRIIWQLCSWSFASIFFSLNVSSYFSVDLNWLSEWYSTKCKLWSQLFRQEKFNGPNLSGELQYQALIHFCLKIPFKVFFFTKRIALLQNSVMSHIVW